MEELQHERIQENTGYEDVEFRCSRRKTHFKNNDTKVQICI